jgi:predicted Zn-dependent protease
VDPQSILITGLTRDGVFLIENGQIIQPVNNFRFNESPVVMLKNADAMTTGTVRIPYGSGSLRVPAIRTHEFNLASVSDAV